MSSLKKKSLQKPLFHLFQISLLFHNFNKVYERTFGLSLVQWCVLRRLIDLPGASAIILARKVGIHPSTLTQTLRRLEKKGLIFVDRDPLDSRKKILSVTRLGKNKLEVVENEMNHENMDISPMNQKFSLLQDLLRKIEFSNEKLSIECDARRDFG
jgi:DNA-binding MarR family transcriptional regulator